MKILVTAPIIAALLFFGSSCGSSNSSCREYAKLAVSAYDEGCAERTDCCFCTCWKDNHKGFDPLAATCTCTKVQTTDDLTSKCDEEDARQCLADKTACQSQLLQSINIICGIE